MGALEATAWALKMAEHELGITPVLSAQAVVAGSDPLGLIAYLSHFHSAFKSTHNPGDLEGRWVGRGGVRRCVRETGERVPSKRQPQRGVLLGWSTAVCSGGTVLVPHLP